MIGSTLSEVSSAIVEPEAGLLYADKGLQALQVINNLY